MDNSRAENFLAWPEKAARYYRPEKFGGATVTQRLEQTEHA